MRKQLLIGDVHATPEELEDCQALMAMAGPLALEHEAEILLLGDSYHTHNVVRVEVMAFWRNTFKELANYGIKVSALVGNHDYAGERLAIHAMMAHEEQIQVIAAPVVEAGVLYMPYYSDRPKFVRDCQELGQRTLVCHQTYAGSKYENGFYAEDGVNPDEFPQEEIISGHIHTPQSFGKVTYIGAPRWRSLSDANTARAIWLYTFDDDGRAVEKRPFSTGGACRQIRYVLDTPESPFDGVMDPSADWRIDIKGPADYIEARKARLAGDGVRIRTFKTEQSAVKVRESEGVGPAFRTFMQSYVPKHGTPIDVLASMAGDRLGY